MKADMNLANSIGRTALHAAFENGRTNIVEYLIDICEVSPFVRCRLVNINNKCRKIKILI